MEACACCQGGLSGSIAAVAGVVHTPNDITIHPDMLADTFKGDEAQV